MADLAGAAPESSRVPLHTANTIAKNLSMPTFSLSLSTLARTGHARLIERFFTESVSVTPGASNALDNELYTASFWGLGEVIESLLASGAAVNAPNPHTLWTPLHAATFQEHANAITLLLAAGANISAADSEGRTPLHFAAASDRVWPLFERHTVSARPARRELVDLKVLTDDLSELPGMSDNNRRRGPGRTAGSSSGGSAPFATELDGEGDGRAACIIGSVTGSEGGRSAAALTASTSAPRLGRRAGAYTQRMSANNPFSRGDVDGEGAPAERSVSRNSDATQFSEATCTSETQRRLWGASWGDGDGLGDGGSGVGSVPPSGRRRVEHGRRKHNLQHSTIF